MVDTPMELFAPRGEFDERGTRGAALDAQECATLLVAE